MKEFTRPAGLLHKTMEFVTAMAQTAFNLLLQPRYVITMHLRLISMISLLLLTGHAAAAQSAKLLEPFKDWTTFVADVGGKKICFASAAPQKTLPKGVNRGSILFYVTNWTGEGGVRGEVSIKIGYTFKPDSKPTVEIGADKFSLFVEDDHAFVEQDQDQARMIDAMRKGNAMIVKGLSNRGTSMEDSYSLLGLSAALDRIAKECPK